MANFTHVTRGSTAVIAGQLLSGASRLRMEGTTAYTPTVAYSCGDACVTHIPNPKSLHALMLMGHAPPHPDTIHVGHYLLQPWWHLQGCRHHTCHHTFLIASETSLRGTHSKRVSIGEVIHDGLVLTCHRSSLESPCRPRPHPQRNAMRRCEQETAPLYMMHVHVHVHVRDVVSVPRSVALSPTMHIGQHCMALCHAAPWHLQLKQVAGAMVAASPSGPSSGTLGRPRCCWATIFD